MTLVLLTPIGLDAGCWFAADLPSGDTVKHVFPGFGGRPRRRPAAEMESLADEVCERCRGDLDVVGVSLGGMVAQHIAIRHPDRVRSLLVACTGAATDPQTMRRRAEAVERGGMESVLADTLERWFTPEALAMRPEHPGLRYARRTLLSLDPGAYADAWRAMAKHDVREQLAQIAAPTTCLAGSADAASPAARSAEIVARVPRSRLVEVDAPHMIHLERPAEFSAALAEHLSWAAGS